MAAGCEKFSLSLTTTFISIIALVLIRIVERRFLHNNKNYKMVKITATVDKSYHEEVHTQFENAVKNIWDFNAKKSDENKNLIKVTMKAQILIDKPIPAIYKELSDLESIKSVNIQEIIN